MYLYTFKKSLIIFFASIVFITCSDNSTQQEPPVPIKEEIISTKLPVLIDTDANNELDDQHALAYLLLNGKTFDLKGITVNATHAGGPIGKHYQEAERILKLCQLEGKIPIYNGANGNFESIKKQIGQKQFDGHEAVDFIIQKAKETKGQKLILIPIGKLTNIALALLKEPTIATNIRIVWLGSNYPEPGEYNQDCDTASMNYILKQDVPFEMVTVRYGDPSGTDAIQVSLVDALKDLPGRGPKIDGTITGRHGGIFNNFGDYAVNLFEHIDTFYVDPPARALYDMAAVAIIKNANWAKKTIIPRPILIDNKWVEQVNNPLKMVVWENFNKKEIIEDMYRTLDHPVLVNGF